MIRSIVLGGFLAFAAFSTAEAGGRNHDTELQATKGDKRLLFQTNADADTFTASNLQVTGSGSIVVPAAQTGFLVATFTSESNCAGLEGGWCNIIINCDGVETEPAVGTDFAFDSVGSKSAVVNFHSLSVKRRSNPFTGGIHSCEVRENLVLGAKRFRLDDWIFKVEFWAQ
jgi:hypothetical protein